MFSTSPHWKKKLLEIYSFLLIIRGEEGVRREGMPQSVIFLILANLSGFSWMQLTFPSEMCHNGNVMYWCYRQLWRHAWPEDPRRGDRRWEIQWSFLEEERRRRQSDATRSVHAAIKPSVEAKGTVQRLESPRTTQLLKIEWRDGIVVTGTIPLEQIYNLISDDIRKHTSLKNVQKSTLERLIFF